MVFLRRYYLQIVGVIAALALAFSLLGVYETSRLPFYMRYVFWAATMATGIVTTFLTLPLIATRWMPNRSVPVQLFASAILASFPVTVVLTLFSPGFDFDSSAKKWAIQFGYVLIVSVVVGVVNYPFMKWLGVFGGTEAAPAEEDLTAAFLQRLPRRYHGAALYGVSAEDHYLRVHTDRGEELILLRFADAVRELDGSDGLQVHRSWWVMQDGVVEARSRAGKKELVLKSEQVVPVSRTYLKAARTVFDL